MATATPRVARVCCAAALLYALGTAAATGIVPWPVLMLAAAALVGGAWRPVAALPVVLAVVPWGERLAAVPVRGSEAVLWAFVAGWCLRVNESRPDAAQDRGLARPVLVFVALVALSWVRVTLAEVTLVAPWARAVAVLRLVPADYLVTAGRDPQTAAALQWLLAAVVFLLTAHLVRRDAELPRRVLVATALSAVAAAAATIVSVPVTYFTTGDWNVIERYISGTRSRGAFHLRDVNAAGSQYILAGLVSLGLMREAAGARPWWRVGQAALVVALWMSLSRAAIVAGALFVGVWLGGRLWMRRVGHLPRVSPHVLGAAAVAVLVALTASARLGSATATRGSASRSLSIRAEFQETSVRMFATAPVLGVGVGTYYQRSNAFMPEGIRAIYGRENAHNYFMQVLAELGVVGLGVFLWWLAVPLRRLWTSTLDRGADSLAFATCLACGAYLLTCVTGHPFLVVEAAVPFWAVLAARPRG
jgi:O-antigen ligase